MSKNEAEQLAKYITHLEHERTNGTKDTIHQAMEVLNGYSRPIAERVMDANIAEALKGKEV